MIVWHYEENDRHRHGNFSTWIPVDGIVLRGSDGTALMEKVCQ